MVRRTVWTFAPRESDLVKVESAHRLTHDFLLVVKILGVDLEKFATLHIARLLEEGLFSCFVGFEELDLKLAHPLSDYFYCLLLHLLSRNLILGQRLSLFHVPKASFFIGKLAWAILFIPLKDFLLFELSSCCFLLFLVNHNSTIFEQEPFAVL